MPSKLTTTPLTSKVVEAAANSAAKAALIAGIHIVDEHEMLRLAEIEALLVAVWGPTLSGAPIPVDLLRSFSHAGCNITAAYDSSDSLCGVAVAIVTPDESTYSLIAGVLPRAADAGVGFALKQHQRFWALARGFEEMFWTFDPLVSRNARFNLTKLGAYSMEYLPNFYGPMHDGINANDESDRLVAIWPLMSRGAVERSLGSEETVELPRFGRADVHATGPDGEPFCVQSDGAFWCRVPHDIVSLRRTSPIEAAAWRNSVREVFLPMFASGHRATGVTRSGWYRLVEEGNK